MKIRYLVDENRPRVLSRRYSATIPRSMCCALAMWAPRFWYAGPDLLHWLELHQRVLVTDNRKSMPGHSADHAQAGGHHWGIFMVHKDAPLRTLADTLYVYWDVTDAEQWMDVTEWLPVWLKAKTRQGYGEVVRIYIAPYDLARVRLEQLSADDIVRWMAALRRKKIARGKQPTTQKLSNGTIAIAFRRLRRALEVARRHKLIGENPAADVDPPAATPSREPIIFEPEHVTRFLAVWEGRRLYALYATEITIGLRPAELLGLRW
jgi:hypothetical protein